MPRNVNPGTLTVGGGLAPSKSVDANALVHPTQGLDGLIAHINDPSRAHEARSINLEDTSGNYASDHVEGALEEIASSLGTAGQNGVIEGGTYSAVGLNVTLASPTTVRIGTDRDLSGDAIALTDNVTQWLYVSATTGALAVSVGASAPSITSPEHVLLAKIVTSGGAITSSTDARFFVANLDRKLPYTVRSSASAANAAAEASFVTLEAALLYLEEFSAGTTSEKTTIIVRGSNTVSTTQAITVNDVVFEGDQDAAFVTGATVAPMFNISGQRVTFRNLLFTAAHASSEAVRTATITGFRVDNCRFFDGASRWTTAIACLGSTTYSVISNTRIQASSYGVRISDASAGNRVLDTHVVGTAATGTAGIAIYDSGTSPSADEGYNQVRGCTVDGFITGIFCRGDDNIIENCTLLNSTTGIELDTSSNAGAGPGRNAVRGCSVKLDSTTGTDGIICDVPRTHISDCDIDNPRTVWVAEDPIGIDIQEEECFVSKCRVTGFYNSATGDGTAIYVDAASDHTRIEGCTIDNGGGGTGIRVDGSDSSVSGCSIEDTETGINITSSGDRVVVSNCVIRLDATNGLTGVSTVCDSNKFSNVYVENKRAVGDYTTETPAGFSIQGFDTQISNCHAYNFYNETDTSGWGFYLASANSDRSKLTGSTADICYYGVEVVSGSDNVTIDGLTVRAATIGLVLGASSTLVSNSNIALDSTVGVSGIQITGTGCQISNCRITNPRTVWTASTENPSGISIAATNTKIVNCFLDGFENDDAGNEDGQGVLVSSGIGITISGSTISNCYRGVLIEQAAASTDVTIAGNILGTLTLLGIRAERCDRLLIANNQISSPGSENAISLIECQDFEATGNLINGNDGVTDYGIYLNGTDASSQRTRKFVVANNTIRAFGTAGIYLEGYVQNGAVNGNQIDGFLSGSDPSATAGIYLLNTGTQATGTITVTGSPMTAGDTIIIGGRTLTGVNAARTPGSNDFEANAGTADLIAASIAAAINDSMNNFSTYVSATVLANVVTVTATLNGTAGNGIGLSETSANATVSGANLSGGTATGTPKFLNVNGNTIQRCRHGIYADGFHTERIQGLTLNANVIHHCARSLGIGFGGEPFGIGLRFVRDATISANEISYIGKIINNSDVESFPTASAHTSSVGIGLWACDQISLVSNVVHDLYTQGVGVGTGIQFHVLDNRSSAIESEAITVVGNSLRSIPTTGISIQCGEPTATTGSILTNLTVADNGIYTITGGAGISITASNRGTITRATVTGNTIRECSDSSLGNGMRVAVVAISGSVLGGAMTNCTFGSNTITDVGVNGCYFSSGASTTFSDLRVVGNTISTATQKGIFVELNNVLTPERVVIDNNTINSATDWAILIDGGDAGEAISISNNVINECATDTGASDQGAIGVITADVDDLTIRGNQITSCGWYNGGGPSGTADVGMIHIEMSGTGGSHDIRIQDNHLESNYGNQIRLESTASVTNHNRFLIQRNVGFVAAGMADQAAVYVDLGTSTTGVDAIWITDNSFDNLSGNGIHLIATDSDPFVEDVRITGNKLSGAALERGIYVLLSTVDGCTTSELLVADNTVIDAGNNGIEVTATNLGTDFDIENVTISRNMVRDGAGHGIVFRQAPDTTSSTLRNLTISHNTVDNCGTSGRDGTGPYVANYSFDNGIHIVIRGTTTNLVYHGNQTNNCAAYGMYISTGAANTSEYGIADAAFTGQIAGTARALVFTSNIARNNDTARVDIVSHDNVGFDGTNWGSDVAGQDGGVILGNLDSGDGSLTGRWVDLDNGATVVWDTANNLSVT